MYFIHEIDSIINLILYQFRAMFLYWAAGIVAGSALSVFAAHRIGEAAGRLAGGRFSLKASALAAALGAASPLCMYGTIPLLAALGRRNMPQYLLATFMVTSILINPNLFIFSFALSPGIAVARLLISILAGIIAGVLVLFFYSRKAFFNFNGVKNKSSHHSDNKNTGCRTDAGQPHTATAHGCGSMLHRYGMLHRYATLHSFGALYRFAKELNGTVLKTAPYFLAGIVLTALFDRLFPKEILVTAFSSSQGVGVLLATSMGVPLYMCGGGTIPLVKSWLDNGMSTGAAMAFMLIGPATKINNLGAVKAVLGSVNFMLYTAFNVVFSIAAGYIIDMGTVLLSAG